MTGSSGATRATLTGLLAVLLWSSVVGLLRSVSQAFGATGGAAAMYTLASMLLLATVGLGRVRSFPRAYLVWGSVLFVAYEICLSLSIGYAHTNRQAIEVGMVNYLWPALTMLCAILFNRQKANWLIAPGVVLALAGVCRVLGGDAGLDPAAMAANVRDNPLSYGLALAGALIWAGYCTVTPRIAGGKNGVTLFFMLTAATLWIKTIVEGGAAMHAGLHVGLHVDLRALACLALAAGAMGFGYAAWNVGILRGNVTLLAGASYFIPVLSAALASKLLHAPLSRAFWQGAAMVCAGSVLCWLATRARR